MTDCAIYVMASNLGPVKIGMSVNPTRRRDVINGGYPFKVTLEHARWVPSRVARDMETRLHVQFADKRINGEWFDVEPSEVIRAIENIEVETLVAIPPGMRRPAFGMSPSLLASVSQWMNDHDHSNLNATIYTLALLGLKDINPPSRDRQVASDNADRFEERLADYRSMVYDERKLQGDWRGDPIPSRPEAIRRLVEAGLSAKPD